MMVERRPADFAASIDLSFNVPMIGDEGEDADPVCRVDDAGGCGVLAVFDGLGGAGSAGYTVDGVVRSGAYLASRCAATVVHERARQFVEAMAQARPPLELTIAAVAETLEPELQRRLQEEHERLGSAAGEMPESRLFSKLIKPMPTTIASLWFSYDAGGVSLGCLWSGDSRCFLLLPNSGLHQLTKDDSKRPGDALDSLVNDNVMSNYLSASPGWRLRSTSVVEHPLPAVLLSATDGCFQYLISPQHLEHTLLGTMRASSTAAEWEAALRAVYAESRGDDASMSIAAVGFGSFESLKDSFVARQQVLASEFIELLDRARALNGEEEGEAAFQALRRESWEAYREGYERYILQKEATEQ